MNITKLEVIQATIDMFFFVFCLIMLVTIKNSDAKHKSMKMFVRLFVIAAFLFLGEALAYVFRGNIGYIDIIVTRIANFVVFAMNIAMANTFVKYVGSILSEKGITEVRKYEKAADILSILNLLILVVNLFYKWMYYFDHTNYYHRNDMWYVYTVISLVVIFLGTILAIKNKKHFEIRSFISIMLFSCIPVIAIVVQYFIYGITIVNLGIGIGSLVMFAAYMYDWTSQDYEEIDTLKSDRFDAIILLGIMLLSMSASIVACTSVIQRVAKQNSEMQSKTIAQMVSAKIENEFIKPITVSQTINQDVNIRRYIDVESRKKAEAAVDEMTLYLNSLGDEFGYQMVFAASEKSKAYYTYNGISKFLDVENDEHDVWYKECLDSGKKYVVNVDTDADNNWDLSVFVNYKMLDSENDVLGVCGVGVNMNYLIDIINKFQDEYDIKVDLVNSDGLIQVDSDKSVIESQYLDNSYFDKVTGNDFYVEYKDGFCFMTKYLEDFDWYIVIRDDNPVKIDINRIVLPIILIFVAGILIMAISFTVISVKQRKAVEAYNYSREASIRDELTSLYNRRGYEIDCDIIHKDNSLNEYSVIMMDLNGLKAANDNVGHEAGDELLVGAAKCINSAFSDLGHSYRVGGDEFVALIKGSREKVDAAVEKLDNLTVNFKGNLISELSISKGVVVCSEHPELSFEEIKELADKLMYEDKDAYYERTGKVRRKV